MKTQYLIQVKVPTIAEWRDYEGLPGFAQPNFAQPNNAMTKREELEALHGPKGYAYKVVKRTTTDEEVDDGVRYCCQYRSDDGPWTFVHTDFMQPATYRTEHEARAAFKIQYAIDHRRIVKLTPLP